MSYNTMSQWLQPLSNRLPIFKRCKGNIANCRLLEGFHRCFPLERCEGESQFPGKSQAEEREEQTRREPLLRKEETSGHDFVA